MNWKEQLITDLKTCKREMHNLSPKPAKRLRASLAALRYKGLLNQLSGADYRGYSRGKRI